MKSIYEEAGGTYTRQGDYELPNLKVPPEKEIEIGVWGQRYRRYLKQHHRIRYYNLLTAGKLNEQLAEVDQQAEWMFQSLVSAFSKQENVTEKLKADRPMEWVQKMNNIRNRASEIVNNELSLHMKEQKFHLYLSEAERRFLVQNLLWFQSKLRQEGCYTDAVDDWIIKLFKSKAEKNQGNIERTGESITAFSGFSVSS